MSFLEALALIEFAIKEAPELIKDVEDMLCRCKPSPVEPEVRAKMDANAVRLDRTK